MCLHALDKFAWGNQSGNQRVRIFQKREAGNPQKAWSTPRATFEIRLAIRREANAPDSSKKTWKKIRCVFFEEDIGKSRNSGRRQGSKIASPSKKANATVALADGNTRERWCPRGIRAALKGRTPCGLCKDPARSVA